MRSLKVMGPAMAARRKCVSSGAGERIAGYRAQVARIVWAAGAAGWEAGRPFGETGMIMFRLVRRGGLYYQQARLRGLSRILRRCELNGHRAMPKSCERKCCQKAVATVRMGYSFPRGQSSGHRSAPIHPEGGLVEWPGKPLPNSSTTSMVARRMRR